MPTIANEGGMLLFINTHDHGPPHVHIATGDWEVRILIGAEASFWNVKRGKLGSREQRKALALVEKHLAAANAKWREIHGEP